MSSFTPWLEPIWQRLLRITQSKKCPHAFLFCGESGLGKSEVVQAFEKLLLCQTPTATGACGLCRSCIFYEEGHHPDWLHFQDEPVGIDDIRSIVDFLATTTHQFGRKVVAIFGVDKLQISASNALLKVLEEPSANTVLILVANKDTVLPTLKSRCFLVNIPMPSKQVASDWLKEQAPLASSEAIQKSLRYAQGAPKAALALMNAMDGHELLYEAFLQGKSNAFNSEEIQQLLTSTPLSALYLIYNFLADFIRVMTEDETGFLYNEKHATMFLQLKSKISAQSLVNYADKVTEAINLLALPGINKSLLFEALFCQWQLLCLQGK